MPPIEGPIRELSRFYGGVFENTNPSADLKWDRPRKESKMKSLTAVIAALALLGSISFASAADSCCDKAKAAGKECDHKCCVKAKKDGKVCEKCNPKKEEAPKK